MPNPTSYISLTGDYGYANEVNEYTTFGNPLETYEQLHAAIRMFVPPGAIVIDFYILVYGNPVSTARYKIPPTDGGFPDIVSYTLAELEASNCSTSGTDEGVLYICQDSVYGGVSVDGAGWLYVFLPFTSSLEEGVDVFTQQFIVKVDSKIYNEWYRAYIGDDPGAWDKYVESVTTYSALSTVDPDPNDTYLSVHQPNGLKTDWLPGSATMYMCYFWVIPDVYHQTPLVKMYVPPGTIGVKASYGINFNTTPGGASSKCSVCYGDIPGQPADYGSTESLELWQIDEFTGYVNQSGGYISAVGSSGGNYSFQDPPITVGKWIYFWFECNSSSTELEVQFTGSIMVDQALYSAWYFSTNWDEYGDPLEQSATTGTVTEYFDPLLEPGAVYPPIWPTPYPWGQKLFPYPFT